MTMLFRTVKASAEALLVAAAAGRYRVLGYQDPKISDEELSRTDRLVQIYYKRGKFPQTGSGRGPFSHDVTLQVRLTVSEPATCDLTILLDPASTSVQIATALAALEPAGKKADDELDELWDIVWNTLMAGDSLDLGAPFNISNRWMPEFEKEDVLPRGRYAVMEGTSEHKFRTTEEVVSTDINDLDFIDTTLTLEDDTDVKAGVLRTF